MKLPIAAYKETITQTINNNRVTIIVAETGAGKSTQVPQYLLEIGYDLIVTQPRRLAAQTLAERVSVERGSKLGSVIGYRTAHERNHSKKTKCLFVTDGLALVRELLGQRRPETVLIIDEIHEWNMNIEVLIAYMKQLLKEDKSIKVVLMSATLEAEQLSVYFNQAPIINVPGRLFPIVDRLPKGTIVQETIELLRQSRNVLVFQPGKAEISRMVEDLQASGVDAEVLPLHGELSSAEQAKCFRSYTCPKCVVATNVAQTSITIDDIDAVVDSGVERRIELFEGVEGLYLKTISIADSNQRRGRSGRCRPGIYVDYCPHSSNRREYPQAEILRTLLDQTVLRLAAQGLDAEKLEFFHQPNPKNIRKAKESLRFIDCMTENNSVTAMGQRVAKLPVSVKYGRMLVEAEDLDVVSEMLTIVSILEVGGIIDRKGPWRRLCWNEKESDLLAQLLIYQDSCGQNQRWLELNGVHAKRFRRAQDIRRHIVEFMRWSPTKSRRGDRQNIIRAICTGLVEHVFVKNGNSYLGTSGLERSLDKDSVMDRYFTLLVGIPFDLSPNEWTTINLINMVTAVTPSLLMEIAPHLVRKESRVDAKFSSWDRCVVSTTRMYFGQHLLSQVTRADPDHPEAIEIMTARMK